MKKFIILACFLITTSAFAANTLPRDGEGTKLQAPSWDATLSQGFTTNSSQTLTISGRLFYEVQCSADCIARLMNTAVKASWVKFTVKANTPFRGSNDSSSTKANAIYLNVSGSAFDYRAQ